MFGLFRKSIARDNNFVKHAVNSTLDISGNVADNKITGGMNQIKPTINPLTKECSHFFLRYPPLIGKVKACIKCGILTKITIN